MMEESFASALRAELDAVVGRYEALVRVLAATGGREIEALRGEAARLASENQRLRAEASDRAAEVLVLKARIEAIERAREETSARAERLEREAQAAALTTASYEAEFEAERRFVEAARELDGSLFGEALAAAVGRPLDAGSATYAALKARGLEAALVAAVKDRGRSAATAPLLPSELAAIGKLAAASGCELVAPAHGTRFSNATMEKASTRSDPAEEGNVLATAMPGLRRAGTEGALVFPRVVVATG